MAGKILTAELFSTFGPLGGVRLATIMDWTILKETRREDGNDQLECSFPLAIADAAAIATGQVIKCVHEDGGITEDLIYQLNRKTNGSTSICDMRCTGIRSYLGTIFPNRTIALAVTGPSAMANAVEGLIGWPAWMSINGTASSPANYALTVTTADSLGSAIAKMLAAVDATLASGQPPCVASFVPTIVAGAVTAYTINIYATVAAGFLAIPAGTVHLLEGKNIGELQDRDDATDPTFPIKGYAVTVDDVYRFDRVKYPNDNLVPFQTARLEFPSRKVDTTQRIVAVITDHMQTTNTQIELGTPLRRTPVAISQAIVAAAQLSTTVAALPPPSTILSVVPLSVTSSQVVLRVFVATPASNQTATITYAVQPSGLAVSPASGQTVAGLGTLGATGHVDFTITRQVFGGQASNIDFTETAPGHLDSTMTVGIETVADLASATKTLRISAADLTATGPYNRQQNSDTSIQSASGANLEQYSTAAPFPEGVTITGMTANLLGTGSRAQCALLRDDGTVVGSTLVSSSGSLADYTQSLSESVGTGGSTHRYSVLVTFNGGAVSADRMVKYVTFSYTSPGLQNTY